MKNLIITLSFIASIFFQQINAQCNNIGFEDGNTNGWTLSGDAVLVSAGNDYYGGFPVSAPGGNFSLRLGNDVTDNLSTATKTITVTATNAFLTYSYAMVLLDFNHTQADAATVSIDVLDQGGNVIPCTFYQVYAAPGGPGGFQQSPNQGPQAGSGTMFPVSYLPWTRATIDLTGYIGQNVTLRVRNDWCVYNVDWGYCYIDAECSDMELTEEPNCVANQTTIVAPDGFVAYAWTGPGIVSGANSNIVTVNQTGTYTLTATTNTGCQIVLTRDVLNLPEYQTAGFRFSDATCLANAATPIQFTDESTLFSYGTTTYEYDFGDGSPFSNLASPTHTYSAPGDYDVTLTITHSDGCVDATTRRVLVTINPTANFNTNPICDGNNMMFNDASTVNAPDFIVDWTWDFGDGSPIDNTQNPTHLFPSNGNYNVSLTVTTDLGCNNTVTLPAEVYPLPQINFTASTVCEDEGPTVFTNNTTVSSGNITNWDWNFADGGTSIAQNPTHNYGIYGDYNVSLTATTNNGCTATDFLNVRVNPIPTSLFDALERNGCLEVCANFNSQATTPEGTVTGWNWDFGNGTTSNVENPNACLNNLSNTNTRFYNITLTVENSFGCTNTLTQANFIEVYPKPLAQFDITPQTTTFLEPDVETDNQSIGNLNNVWSSGDGTDYHTTNFAHTYADTGSYLVTLTVENGYGCTDDTSKIVRVNAKNLLYVPNTFTPDGDGKNDLFFPVGFDIVERDYNFYIFNKDGDLIFQTDNLTKAWDGTEKGKPAKTDTYVWRILYRDSKGEKYEKMGHVNLLR